MNAYLGLDLGEKRVGIAVSDEMGMLATPLQTLEFKSRKFVLAEISRLAVEYRASFVVVGFPITLKGTVETAALKVKEHVKWFESNSDLAWILWDERMSTQEVERLLIDADVRRSDRKNLRDKLAAQRILQNYLDFQRSVKDRA